jgi:hypothetical protein
MPFTRAQDKAALKYVVVLTVSMNQPPVDGPMAKSLAEAMIENIEDLGSLIETNIEKLSFIATAGEDHIEESYEPSLPSSGIVLHRIIPSVITGMQSRKKSLTRVYRFGPSFNGTIFGSPSVNNPGTPAAFKPELISANGGLLLSLNSDLPTHVKSLLLKKSENTLFTWRLLVHTKRP